jgi:hypothetical protein
MLIRLEVFRAVNRKDLCEKYLAGHQQVLKDYGIENITTNNADWFHQPNVYGIVAYLNDGEEVVGGIRVHIADGKEMLPVEKAIGFLDPEIHRIIKNNLDDGTGEICGLWNAKIVSGWGLSIVMLRAGISIVSQLKMDSLFTICADYTMKMVRQVGFVHEDSLGDQGTFAYPNVNYIARVLRKLNTETLDTAEEYDKEKIKYLRNNPMCELLEQGPKGEYRVRYQLKISS